MCDIVCVCLCVYVCVVCFLQTFKSQLIFMGFFTSMIQLCFLQTSEITAGFYGFCHSGPAVTPTSPRASQLSLVIISQLCFFQTTAITVYLYGFLSI